MEIVGLASLALGCRLFWQGQDAAANVIYTRQRDSTTHIYGTVYASGHLDAEAYQFQVTLPVGATGCTYRIYTTALLISDQWFDTAIYGPTFTDFQSMTLGMDGVLFNNVATLGAGAGATYILGATYRGPVFVTQSATAAESSSMELQETDYTGANLRNATFFSLIPSGGYSIAPPQIVWLGGTGYTIGIQNSGSGAATFTTEIRAIRDLA